MIITGKITSGLGKGQYYVEKYQQFFIEHLEFIPYSGTLNLIVDKIPTFPEENKIIIKPSGQGQVDCYPIKINNKYKGAIVIPHKTRHGENVIEIISPKYLREEYHDGEEIKCELV